MTFHLKVFISFLFFIISTSCFAHVAGVTDTGIHVDANSIDLIYTIPFDNINEFTEQEKNELNKTIMEGFVINNTTGATTSRCDASLVSKRELKNIQSEQFHLRYICRQPLDKLSIIYTLFLPEYASHKNYVRLSIAGRSQSFTYSSLKTVHKIPVQKLTTAWGVVLIDKSLKNNSVAEKSSQNTSQNGYQNHANKMGFIDLLLQSKNYFSIGVEHILLGYDHVLFLIALLLLPLGFRSVVIVATSFTIAHSITLTVSVFELFTLPAPYVEAVIALSIVYIAVENIRLLKRRNNSIINDKYSILSWKRRSAITFMFGLLHGFGFSYVLKEIGLGDHIAGSLLFFNLGVEFGQLLIITVCFPLLWLSFRKLWGNKLAINLSVLIGLIGLFWLAERIYFLI